MRCALRRLGAPAFRAASAAAAVAALHSQGECQLQSSQRFESLPEKYTPQRFTPGVAYPGWDHNWDYLNLPPKAVAKDLGHAWPIHDYAEAIKKLFAEHYEFGPTAKYKTMADVEKLIGRRKHDLPELYRESYMLHAWGGAPRRIIILVRHGQYVESRELESEIKSKLGIQQFELEERLQRGGYKTVDAARVLTPLGRSQAIKAGDRLASMLEPPLTTPGREGDVRLHVSTATRAMETADVIATQLPTHVRRLPPDANLTEGNPIMDMPGCSFADGASIFVEGSRIEAAFRSLFYRGVPRKPPAQAPPPHPDMPRVEYEIVVCHQNVIRYFFLRALQLPPEAWLRFGGYNTGITILSIRPASGRVSALTFGDCGHLDADEVTFGMHKGIE